MKNITNEANNIYRVINEEATKTIQEETKKLEKEAEVAGRQLAEEKKPRLSGDSIEPFIMATKAGYKALSKKVAKLMASGEEEREAKDDEQFMKEQIKASEQKKEESAHRLKSHQVQRDKIVMDYNWNRYYAILGILGLIAIIQVFIDGASLQALNNFNLLTAYVFAAGLAISTVTISHKIKVILELVHTRAQKIALFTGVLGLFALVYFAIASFRITMDGEGASFAAEATQILSFVLLNELILIGSLTLAFFALPSKQDDQKKQKFDELSKYIDKYESEVDLQEKAIGDFKEGLHNRNVLRQKNKKLAQDSQEYIASLYEGAVGKFIQSNCACRADGIPDCFSKDIRPLFNEAKIVKL